MIPGVRFSMPLAPVGKGRAKATAIGNRARVYTPAKTRNFETSVALLAKAAMQGKPPLEGPLQAHFRFRMALPKSMTKKQRAAVLAGHDWYLGAYDLDNMVKAICDGMNAVVYGDDKQIVRTLAEKIGSDQPGIDILIKPMEPAA